MNTLRLNLPPRGYDILVGNGILNELGFRCRSLPVGRKAALVSNPAVSALYGDAAARSLQDAGFDVICIDIPDGEEYKNSATLNLVYDRLIEAGLDRSSLIVALGGGVVGDLAGFAAATFMRGIPLVQAPTTLLSQVDSSVGGKTAIDHPRGKNLIGAFHQPSLVVIDGDTLSTLDRRQFYAGLAEAVKYGIVLDADFFNYLEESAEAILALEPQSLNQVILKSCAIKARVVEQDEKESGLRAVLNYGHTLGHAFETVSGYGTLLHGEAVAMGMALMARASVKLGFASEQDGHRITALLQRFRLSLEPPSAPPSTLATLLEHDKKSRDGTINCVCNCGIGKFEFIRKTPSELLSICGLEV